jgi:hypothetical protein
MPGDPSETAAAIILRVLRDLARCTHADTAHGWCLTCGSRMLESGYWLAPACVAIAIDLDGRGLLEGGGEPKTSH